MRTYDREAMTRQETGPCGFVMAVCNLCGGRSLEAETVSLIEHEPDCVLADPDVMAVTVVARHRPEHRDSCGSACKHKQCIVYGDVAHEDLMIMCELYANARMVT